ncbi:hypothetical protein [Pseudanabaena minima]|uniref:hypothetical protein n=1 Tax=Pseudanabaena minima TaxID=890415 RepID=UPI003DA9A831
MSDNDKKENTKASNGDAKASFEKADYKEYEDWKRIRSVIEHENNLINYRQTWLILPQGFLISGFIQLLFNSIDKHIPNMFFLVIACIPILLIFFCVIMINSINAAENHLEQLDRWWYLQLEPKGKRDEYYKDLNKDLEKFCWKDKKERDELVISYIDKHPPLQGWTDRRKYKFYYPLTPILFIGFWSVMLVLCIVLLFVSPIV